LRARHLVEASLSVGRTVNHIRGAGDGLRWDTVSATGSNDLVQIEP
jgi:hypothetical protein